jgi:hypothetical protein
MRPFLFFFLVSSVKLMCSTLAIRLRTGVCRPGELTFEPSEIDLGTFQVHEPAFSKFSLRNNSDCMLQYNLSVILVEPSDLGALEEEDAKTPADWRTGVQSALSSVVQSADGRPAQGSPAVSSRRSKTVKRKGDREKQPLAHLMELDFPKGTIQARSNKLISLRFKAHVPVKYKFVVVCSYDLQSLASAAAKLGEELKATEDSGSSTTRRINAAELTIVAKGGFPKLLIVDARMENHLNADLVCVRRQLSMQLINRELNSPLSALEKTLHTNPEQVPAFTARDLIKMLKSFDINFGVGELNNAPKFVFFKFKNVSPLAVSWSIRYPEEVSLHIEQWADQGDPTTDERWQQAIMDRGLFHVTPKGGTIAMNEEADIKITYFHKFPGRHLLPITLQINHGKNIALNLIGQTVTTIPPLFTMTSFPFVYKPSDPIPEAAWQTSVARHYVLDAVPLGLEMNEAPVQQVPLFNDSQWPLQYSIGMSVLEDLREQSFGMPIYEILNPEGIVAPDTTSFLLVVFRPLQVCSRCIEIEFPPTTTDGRI